MGGFMDLCYPQGALYKNREYQFYINVTIEELYKVHHICRLRPSASDNISGEVSVQEAAAGRQYSDLSCSFNPHL